MRRDTQALSQGEPIVDPTTHVEIPITAGDPWFTVGVELFQVGCHDRQNVDNFASQLQVHVQIHIDEHNATRHAPMGQRGHSSTRVYDAISTAWRHSQMNMQRRQNDRAIGRASSSSVNRWGP